MMNLRLLALASILVVGPAQADSVIVLKDNEKAALIQVIAAGLQAQPQLSSVAVFLLNQINTAPTLTSQTATPPPNEPPPNDQSKGAPQ